MHPIACGALCPAAIHLHTKLLRLYVLDKGCQDMFSNGLMATSMSGIHICGIHMGATISQASLSRI